MTGKTKFFFGGGLDGDLILTETKLLCDLLLYPWNVRAYFWSLQADGAIDVPYLISTGTQELSASLEENAAGNPFVSGIGIGEMTAYIAQGRRTQHGVTYGMKEDISIGMPHGTLVMFDFNATKPEGDTLFQAVYIISETNPEAHGMIFINSGQKNQSPG